MAVSMFNDTDLKIIAGMEVQKLRSILGGKSINEILIFRRNLQISLANYSKKNRSKNGKLDPIHGAIIGLCHQIETMARNTFTLGYWRRVKREIKGLTPDSKRTWKIKIKNEWEKIIMRFSF
jgi:hypothetical protein